MDALLQRVTESPVDAVLWQPKGRRRMGHLILGWMDDFMAIQPLFIGLMGF